MIIGRNEIDLGFNRPTDTTIEEEPEETSFGKTFMQMAATNVLPLNKAINSIKHPSKASWAYLRQTHEAINAYSYLKNSIKPLLKWPSYFGEPFDVPAEELMNYNEKYWPYLLEATHADDFESRKNKLNREFNDIRLISTLDNFDKLMLGALTVATSPSTYLPGGLTAFRGAIQGATVLQSAYNVAKAVAPKVALSSAITNLPSYLNRPTISTEEYALNTFISSVIAGGLYAIGGAGQHALQSNIRVAMVADYKYDPKAYNVVNGKTGKMTGTKVVFTEDNATTPTATSTTTNVAKNVAENTTTNVPAATTSKMMTREELLAKLVANAEKTAANGASPEELALMHQDIKQQLSEFDKSNPPETPSEKSPQLITNLLQENQQDVNLSNLTDEQILALTKNEIAQYYDKGINNTNDTFLKTFGFAALPIVKGLTSQFPVVKDFTERLFGSNFIISNMTHPDIQAVEKNIAITKHQLKKIAGTSPSEEAALKNALKMLRIARKDVIRRLESEGDFYSGIPTNSPSAQSEAAEWVNNFQYLMYEARQIWLKHIGLGDIESNLPFAELWQKAKNVATKSNKGRSLSQQHLDAALNKAYQEGDVQTIMDIHKNPEFIAEDATLNWEALGNEVCYALRRGEKSRIPAAEEISKLLREKLLDPLLKRAQELNLLPEYMDVRTAISYLSRVMDQQKMTTNRERLVDKIIIYAIALNAKIAAIKQPITDANRTIADTKKLIADELAKGDKKDKRILLKSMNDLQHALQKKTMLQEELQHKIDTGTLELTQHDVLNCGLTQAALIDSRVTLTAKHKKEYAELTKDLQSAREDLKHLRQNAFAEEMEILKLQIKQNNAAIANEAKAAKKLLKEEEAKQLSIISKDSSQKINTLEHELNVELKKIDSDNKQEFQALSKELQNEYARLNKAKRTAITEKNKQAVDELIKQHSKIIKDIESKLSELPKIVKQLSNDATLSTKSRIKELEGIAKDLHASIRKETNTKVDVLEKHIKNELDFIEEEKKTSSSNLNKTAKTHKKQTKDEILAEQEEVKQRIKLHKQEIQRKIEAGLVSEELYHDVGGKLKLRNIDNAPLTQIADSIKDPALYANNIVDTWKGYNEKEMAGEMFGALRRGGGKPKSTKERTVLCTDYWIEDFLLNDPQMVVGSYVSNMANYLALENMFQEYGKKLGISGRVTADNGESYLIKELKKSYELKRKEINDQYLSLPAERSQKLIKLKERDKALIALDADFSKYQAFIKESLQVFRGDYGRPTSDAGYKMAEYANNLTRYATATMLGGTALMIVGDMIMPMFRVGPWRHIVDGLIPMFGSLLSNPLTATDAFKDCRVGISMALSSARARVFGEITQQNFRSSRRTSLMFDNMSKFAMNATLLSPTIDFCETAAAFTMSARLIRAIDKYFSKGKFIIDSNGKQIWQSSARFSKKELEWLQASKFDMNKYGERVKKMLDGVPGKHKGYKEKHWGGIIPHESKWTDLEAAQHFRMFITNQVDQTQNRAGMGDKPYFTKHPLGKILAQFYSWGFAATNNFTIPTLQRADKEKLMWCVLSLAAGAIVGPLRDLAEGRKPDLTPRKLWVEAVTQSGIGGYQLDLIVKLNALLGSPLGAAPDRYGHRKFSSMALGAGGAIADRAFEAAGALARGEADKKLARRAIRMIPGMNAAYARRPINEIMDTMPE